MNSKLFYLALACFLSVTITNAQDAFLGEVRIFAGSFAPRGWAFCDGTLLPVSQNQALYSLLGTAYGGDGRTTFALPNLKGRAIIGSGTGAGLRPYFIGQFGGVEINELNINQLPTHNHDVTIINTGTVSIPVNTLLGSADERSPGAGVLANTGADRFTANKTVGATYSGSPIAVAGIAAVTLNTGSGTAVENRQPYLVLNYIICMDGIYPVRP